MWTVDAGTSKKGVALYRNADVLLRASQFEGHEQCFIIVCKVCSAHNSIIMFSSVFGRLFVKRFCLFYQTIVCSVCLVCDVVVLWPNVGWIKDAT